MLSIFRRHLKTCPSRPKGRAWKRWSCPIWIGGSIGNEKVRRRSMNLTSREAAETLLVKMKQGGSKSAPHSADERTTNHHAKDRRNLARLYRRASGSG